MEKYGNKLKHSLEQQGQTSNEVKTKLEATYANFLSLKAIDRAVDKLEESGADRVMVNSGTGGHTHWVTLHKDDQGDWRLLDSLTPDQPKMDLREFLTKQQRHYADDKGLDMNAQILIERSPKKPSSDMSYMAFNKTANTIATNLKSEGWNDSKNVSVEQLKTQMDKIVGILGMSEPAFNQDMLNNLQKLDQAMAIVADYTATPGDYSIPQETINDINDLKAAAEVFLKAYQYNPSF